MRTFWLSFHVDYACRHSGVCCSSGWPIPVERDRVIPIQRLIDRGDVPAPESKWLEPVTAAPDDVAGTLALQSSGRCVFHRLPTGSALPTSNAGSALPSNVGCAIHDIRPSSCAHFPFVCLIDSRGVHVTLSHYCPTAASMLFDHTGPTEIVAGPAPVAGLEVPEGLDAREALPPLESPARLMSLEDFARWEREAVKAAATGVMAPPVAHRTLALFDQARASVPAPLTWPAAPDDLEAAWSERVLPIWDAFAIVVARYRAAKVFASWAAYQSDGTAAVLRVADIAQSVLRVEVVRQCARARRRLDAELLKEAIRRSDLLMVHYADPRVLSSAHPTA